MTDSTGGSPTHSGSSRKVDAEADNNASEPIDLDIDASGDESQALREAEQFAVEFLKKILRLRGVRIDREQFLTAELHKRGIAQEQIRRAVSVNPVAAGLPQSTLDDIAQASIDFETKKSTALSFAAGPPGGLAMAGTVPGDITQYYAHAFRVMQKVAYVYGWQSFLADVDDVDDETLGKLATFLGIMMGVGGASASIKSFAVQVARPAIQKQIANQALTKTAWYVPMKQTLRLVGVHVTKHSFAKTVTKVVPVVGGVLSGGLTFVSLKVQSNRLKDYLREVPPPNVDAAEYAAASASTNGTPEAETATVRKDSKNTWRRATSAKLKTVTSKLEKTRRDATANMGSLVQRTRKESDRGE